MDTLCVAGFAKDVPVERVATVTFGLGRQLQITIFALVTVNVEAPIKSNNSNCLLLAGLGHNRLLANAATRGKLLVKVFNAMDLAVGRYGKGDVV